MKHSRYCLILQTFTQNFNPKSCKGKYILHPITPLDLTCMRRIWRGRRHTGRSWVGRRRWCTRRGEGQTCCHWWGRVGTGTC